MEEKFWQLEEQKEENNCQRRPHICGLFFYVKMETLIMNNKDFQVVYRKGKSYANKYLVMYLLDNNKEENRLGISVSKKVGNSIVRHRITRLIRESYRLQEEKLKNGYDIVIVARTDAKGKTYAEIESALIHLGRLHNIIEESAEI